MFFTVGPFLLAPLFVFGVYHLLTWFNVLRINEKTFWKRVAIASAICHLLLAGGFFAFSYFDAGPAPFGPYLFNESNFWKLMEIFDTAAMAVVLILLVSGALAAYLPALKAATVDPMEALRAE